MKDAKAIMAYSRALLELASESGKQEIYRKVLEKIQNQVTEDLLAISENPAFSAKERQAVLSEVAQVWGLDDALKAFLILLAQNSRLRRLRDILIFYRRLLYRASNRQLVSIRSAQPLSGAEKEKILAVFARLEKGVDLDVEHIVDPKLIGGVVVEVGSKVFDGSVRGQLNRLKASLLGSYHS